MDGACGMTADVTASGIGAETLREIAEGLMCDAAHNVPRGAIKAAIVDVSSHLTDDDYMSAAGTVREMIRAADVTIEWEGSTSAEQISAPNIDTIAAPGPRATPAETHLDLDLVRVITVVNWRTQRVHGVTRDQAEAQRWIREIVAEHAGDQNAATMTVGLVNPEPGPRADHDHQPGNPMALPLRLAALTAEVEQWRAAYGASALRDARKILVEREHLKAEVERLKAGNAEMHAIVTKLSAGNGANT